MVNNIPPEEYISILKELKALEYFEVKRFRIYDRKPNIYKRSDAAWCVRNTVVDDGEYSDDICEDKFCKSFIKCIHDDILNRISMRLQINCVKEQALIK
ncbi:hypothetical protein DPMN_009556 [Dreissena polymorpha]|uniref:Uncharacterized protein n=1 Tax=Dreissena polymorpha TaxID=45954 RepID=A0A9D4MZU4_DREPO|nr:hypothetical protein DPMN_009556 [Dreissena polymorpha]